MSNRIEQPRKIGIVDLVSSAEACAERIPYPVSAASAYAYASDYAYASALDLGRNEEGDGEIEEEEEEEEEEGSTTVQMSPKPENAFAREEFVAESDSGVEYNCVFEYGPRHGSHKRGYDEFISDCNSGDNGDMEGRVPTPTSPSAPAADGRYYGFPACVGSSVSVPPMQTSYSEYRYHVYGTGRLHHDWEAFLADTDMGDGGNEEEEEDEDEEDPEFDEDNDAEGCDCNCLYCADCEGCSCCGEIENEEMLDHGLMIQNQDYSEGQEEDDEDSFSSGELHQTPSRSLNQMDIVALKTGLLTLLPASKFMDLPQVQRYVEMLSKEEILSLLHSHLGLDEISAVRKRTIITRVVVHHPSEKTLNSIKEVFASEAERETIEEEYDFVAGLREENLQGLRGILKKALCGMDTARIYQILIEPRVMYPVLELMELYGSAVVMAGQESERSWWGNLYAGNDGLDEDEDGL
ncbi:hypothetical protein BDV18DRAFT_158729 [Aspergillus unguis]